jgi:hypothetical protein
MMIDPEVSKQLDKILRNILWFCVKNDEVPCAAESHLDNAICDLLALLPEFETDCDEMVDKLDSAVEHMQLLGYKPAVCIELGIDFGSK